MYSRVLGGATLGDLVRWTRAREFWQAHAQEGGQPPTRKWNFARVRT
ncbi:hypothetical protein [Streptomyces sp. NPDC060035]